MQYALAKDHVHEMLLLPRKIVLRSSTPRNNRAEFRSAFVFFWYFPEVLKELKIFQVRKHEKFGNTQASAKRSSHVKVPISRNDVTEFQIFLSNVPIQGYPGLRQSFVAK